MERLTVNYGKGWVLRLDNPKNDAEARQQLMAKYLQAIEKLAIFEDFLDKYKIQDFNKFDKDIDNQFNIQRDNIKKFINELAWQDVQYDAFQSTMGEFTGSSSAVPRYAKKYYDLWKEMFNESLLEE